MPKRRFAVRLDIGCPLQYRQWRRMDAEERRDARERSHGILDVRADSLGEARGIARMEAILLAQRLLQWAVKDPGLMETTPGNDPVCVWGEEAADPMTPEDVLGALAWKEKE